MGELNIPQIEQDTLMAVDIDALNQVIEQCLSDEHPRALRAMRLASCGLHVGSRLREYEAALTQYGNAKSAKKRDETRYDALRAGRDLACAVEQMKRAVETHERESLLFRIDDLISQPSSFSELMTVQVHYQWRRAAEDSWAHECITFEHKVNLQPNYMVPPPKRKPSAAQQERDRQDELRREWMHLMRSGLYSVRAYFRDGRDGAAIPSTFRARVDPHTRGLNNFSTDFWLDRS